MNYRYAARRRETALLLVALIAVLLLPFCATSAAATCPQGLISAVCTWVSQQ